MKDPLGVSPSKGNQGTARGKEKILLTSLQPVTIRAANVFSARTFAVWPARLGRKKARLTEGSLSFGHAY